MIRPRHLAPLLVLFVLALATPAADARRAIRDLDWHVEHADYIVLGTAEADEDRPGLVTFHIERWLQPQDGPDVLPVHLAMGFGMPQLPVDRRSVGFLTRRLDDRMHIQGERLLVAMVVPIEEDNTLGPSPELRQMDDPPRTLDELIEAIEQRVQAQIDDDDGNDSPLTLEAVHPEVRLPHVGLPAELTVTHEGDEPIVLVDFRRPDDLHAQAVRVEVHAGDTNVYRGHVYRSMQSLELREPGAPVVLEPGGSRSFRVTLRSTYHASNQPVQPLFAQPGSYRVRFIYPVVYRPGPDPDLDMRSQVDTDMRDEVVSEWQDLPVKLPREHTEAYDAMQWLSRPHWLLEHEWAMSSLRRDQDRQRQWDEQLVSYVDQYPDAPWTAYAQHARARVAELRGRNHADDDPKREAHLRRAAELAEHAAESANGHRLHPLQRDALELARRLRDELGEQDAASELLQQRRQLHGRRDGRSYRIVASTSPDEHFPVRSRNFEATRTSIPMCSAKPFLLLLPGYTDH